MTRLSRRHLLASGGAIAALGSGAHGPGWATRASAQSPAAMKIAWAGSAERASIIKGALAAIQAKMPGVRITSETGTGGQFGTKIAAQLAAGGGPDIWITQILALADFADGGAAQDLTRYVPQPIDMRDWDNQAIVGARYKGTQYAVSTGSNTFIGMYDPALTEKAGLGVLPPDWTWAKLADYAGQIAAANKAARVFGCADASGDLQIFQVYTRSFGGELFDADNRFLPTQDDIVAFWDYWAKLRAAGVCVTPDIQTRFQSGGDIAQHPIVQGKAAIDFDFSNRFLSIEKLANKPLATTTLPMGDRPGMFFRPSLMWMISVGADHKDRAAEVVNALVNDPEVGLLLNGQLGAPDNPAIYEKVRAAAGPSDQRVYSYLDLARAKYVTPLEHVVYPRGGGGLGPAFTAQAESYAFGQASAQKAAATFLGVVKQSLGQ